MMLRIPGSINSKNGQRVTVLRRWDGQRPYNNWILRDFRDYLIDKKLKKKVKAYKCNLVSNYRLSTNLGSQLIFCKHCNGLIDFDNNHISQSGKKIPLDSETGKPHDCKSKPGPLSFTISEPIKRKSKTKKSTMFVKGLADPVC